MGIQKIAGEGAGKCAAKIRGPGGSAGEGAAPYSLEGEGAAPYSFPRKAPLTAPSPALPPAPRVFAALFPDPSPAIFWIGPGSVDPRVPGRFAFPGARNPRICSVSRCRKIFPAIFSGLSRSFPEEPPGQTPETATAFSSF